MSRPCILWLLFALLTLTACALPAPTRQVKVRMVDAGAPGTTVPGASIDVHFFPGSPEAPDPDHAQSTANAQGEAMVQGGSEPAIWQVRAEGYLEQRLVANGGALPLRYAAHAGADVDGVIHLYRAPEPRLTLLINEGYVGPLTVQLEPAPGFDYVVVDGINVTFAAVDPRASYVQGAPGQRDFVAVASPEGAVYLVVTPLLYDIQTHQLRVREGSGVLPQRDLADQDLGRGVWGEANPDDKQLHRQIRLFVGTGQEYTAYLRSG